MTRLALFAMLLFSAVVAGCNSAPTKSNYEAYAEAQKAQADAQATAINSLSAAASACGDDRCVEHVVSMAALASVKNGAGSGSGLAGPPREPSGAEKFAAIVGALSPLLGNAITGAVTWHQSDNAVKQSDAQYRYLDHVLTSALDGMATTAGNAVPSITVGGNLGDTYGDNFTGRDRTDVAGNLANGNGNVFGDRNFNSGRQDAPGPFEGSCSGDSCQPQPAPGGE